jgi:hypothetical protein
MGDEQPQGRPVAHKISGHEVNRLRLTGLFLSAAALLAMTTMALAVVATIMSGLSREEKPLESLAAPRFAGDTGEYPSPRIQADPTAELTKMKAEDFALLSKYGWIDRKAGIAHIPVERAIDILAKSGLPVAPAGDAKPASPAAIKGSSAVEEPPKPAAEGKRKP